jgi:transposase
VQQDDAVGHAEADDAPLETHAIASNLPEEEEDTSDRTSSDDEQAQRSPIPLANLNLSSMDGDIRAQIETLHGQWCSYYKQVRTVTDFLRSQSWSLSKIAAVLRATKGTLSKVYARSLTPRLKGGRPSALTIEQLEFVEVIVRDAFDRRESVTYSEIMIQLELEYGVCLLPDTLRHVIRRIPWCKTIDDVPQEASRVHCDEAAIDQYYEDLERMLQGVPAAAIYNVDETGFNTWVDASRLKVLVPADFEGTEIPIPVSRNDKRASCIACIVASGRALKPLIVIPRKTIEIDLYECGFTPDTCHILFQENGFLTTDLFVEWAMTVFFPDTIQMRQSLGYEGPVFLVLDGFSGHIPDTIEEQCLFYGVVLVVVPPHTSDQVQPLDLGFFALHKLESHRVRPHTDLSAQTVKILKILCGLQKASTPLNIIKAFRRAGIISQWDVNAKTLVCRVDRQQAKEVRHWHQSRSRVSVVRQSIPDGDNLDDEVIGIDD